jgi:hypothetical protein
MPGYIVPDVNPPTVRVVPIMIDAVVTAVVALVAVNVIPVPADALAADVQSLNVVLFTTFAK